MDEYIEFRELDGDDFAMLSASARAELMEWAKSLGFDPGTVTSMQIVGATDASCTVFVTTHHVVCADVAPPACWPRTAVRDVVEFPYEDLDLIPDGATA